MDASQYIDQYEQKLHEYLWKSLQSKDLVDSMEPDVTDFESVWQQVCTSYIPDGVREFEGYPTVSVGWMMYVGMALASLWDKDWENTLKQPDIYTALRDTRGYDLMDEYISEIILGLNSEESKQLAKILGECSQSAVHSLQREQFEAGSPLAFHAYVRTLHQMYLIGVSVQLFKMGYRMKKME
ncbi:MAG: hypothetical protein MJZ19_01035 [Paludibacteraceae bacterium]|nr:hypothetical protein [Paludibacteraceae bacterium]